MKSNNFDALRLLAAFAVLISHCWPIGFQQRDPIAFGFALGTVAVCVFFWISGYLVTASWQRTPDIFSFAKARALRIYPALLVNTLISILLLGAFVTTLPVSEYFQHTDTWKYLSNATAIKLQANLPSVFSENPIQAVNGSLWTLPYEVTCYVVLVGAMLATRGRTYRIIALSTLLLLMHIAVLAKIGNLEAATSLERHYYHLSKFAVAFFLGVICRIIRVDGDRFRPPLFIGAALFFALLISLPDGVAKTYAGIFAICTTTAAISFHAPAIRLMPHAWGDWSYGVYIYAFPVQQILREYWGPNSLPLYALASAAITVILAAASWFLVEKPAIKLKSRKVLIKTPSPLSSPQQ